LDPRIAVGMLLSRQELPKTNIILIDAKHFVIRKRAHSLYVCLDALTSEPMAWMLLERYELREGYDRILSHLKSKKLNIEAVISDGAPSIKSSITEWYPEAIQQKCAFHILMHAFRQINGRRVIKTEYGRKVWKMIRKIALEYREEWRAKTYLHRMKKKYPDYQKTWRILERNLPDLYQFTKRPDLPIPRTSNQIENFMGVLEQRLKTSRSFKNPDSLIKIISAFIKLKYKSPTK
jgi:transposase-like protein